MLDNNSYNLMAQLVEESQSLWRIKNTYKRDASMCQECEEFWQRLERDKENTVRELEKLVHEHMMASQPEMAGSRR
jgi:hypothetical protein